MDARKIQFLIGMQREIDKLEAKDGSTPKIEKVKSRFYDVVEIKEIVKDEKAEEENEEVPEQNNVAKTTNLSKEIEDKDIAHLMENLKRMQKELRKIQSDRELVFDSPSHKPKEVVEFLKLFKYDNDIGYKDLVHSPDSIESFNFPNVIHSSLQHFSTVYQKNYLPYSLSDRLINLFDILSTHGLTYWNTQSKPKHPLYNNSVTTRAIQKFKQSYRFDEEKTEATILRELILGEAMKATYESKKGKIKFYDKFSEIDFLPNQDFFDLNSIFFADVESFKSALKAIFESLIKHTNIKGKEVDTNSKKKIVIETVSQEMPTGYIYKLKICDLGAITKKSAVDVVNSFRGQYKKPLENETYKPNSGQAKLFRSVCDWSVTGVFAGKPRELIIQPFKKEEDTIIPIGEDCCNGFTHIFTFYG